MKYIVMNIDTCIELDEFDEEEDAWDMIYLHPESENLTILAVTDGGDTYFISEETD